MNTALVFGIVALAVIAAVVALYAERKMSEVERLKRSLMLERQRANEWEEAATEAMDQLRQSVKLATAATERMDLAEQELTRVSAGLSRRVMWMIGPFSVN